LCPCAQRRWRTKNAEANRELRGYLDRCVRGCERIRDPEMRKIDALDSGSPLVRRPD
jgi:hypothetical protein